MPRQLNRVFVLTGSGISADSGIPTFRGRQGYWRNLDPTKLATESAFVADPMAVWQWYRERRECIAASQPNAAHAALVKLAGLANEFLLVTQNVDDLHGRAQWDGRHLEPAQIVQIHGDIFATRCSRCDFRRRNILEDVGDVPKCPRCGAPLRPDVVWFDEELEPAKALQVNDFLGRGACDLVLVIGTTAVFSYIVDWAIAAKAGSGVLLEINPNKTALSPFVDEMVRERAAKVTPEIVDALTSPRLTAAKR